MAKSKEKTETTPLQLQGGANITAIKKQGLDLANKYIAAKKRRTLINEELGQIRAAAEELGIPKKAFTDAIKYKELDTDKREGYDEGYGLMREALGVPVAEQLDLFGEENEETANGAENGEGWPDTAAIAARQEIEAAEQSTGAAILEDGVAAISGKTTAKPKAPKKKADPKLN